GNREARTRNRRVRTRDQRTRAGDGRARFLRKPRRRAADDRSPSGADVESWRPDAPLGGAPNHVGLVRHPLTGGRTEVGPGSDLGPTSLSSVTKSSADYKFVIIIQRGCSPNWLNLRQFFRLGGPRAQA